MFGQLNKHLRNWDDRYLRRSFVHMSDAGQARAFFVRFQGEGVDDHGGPYRAALHAAAGEEVADFLELLVPCANGQSEGFQNRDKVVFNTSKPIATMQPLFVFFGKLLALSCRHSVQIPLSLPGSVWKALAGEALTSSDVKAVDTHTTNALERFVEGGAGSSAECELMEQMLLCQEGGGVGTGKTTVSPKQAHRLLDLATASAAGTGALQRFQDIFEHLHLMSQKVGICSLHRGLGASVPTELFPIFTATELEELFCGAAIVDSAVLKQATEYDGVSVDDPHIVLFWEALEVMDCAERAELINFCSGRSRLPSSAAAFSMTFKLQAPNPRSLEDPDAYLPLAQTCFFSLSLPKYSSLEVMLQKLRYAIHNTELMDADVLLRRADGWESADRTANPDAMGVEVAEAAEVAVAAAAAAAAP